MGNALECFGLCGRSQESYPSGTVTEADYAAFAQAANRIEGGTEEKIERKGSMYPSPVTKHSGSSSSLIPPHPSDGTSSSGYDRRRGTAVSETLPAPKKSKEVRILLLGSGESGKSTIIKQMKIIHQNGYSREEMLSFRPFIYKNIMMGVEQVINAVEALEIDTILEKCHEQITFLRTVSLDYETMTRIPEELVDAINFLWLEGGVKVVFDQLAHNSYIFESAS